MTVDLNWSKYATPERRVDQAARAAGVRAAVGARPRGTGRGDRRHRLDVPAQQLLQQQRRLHGRGRPPRRPDPAPRRVPRGQRRSTSRRWACPILRGRAFDAHDRDGAEPVAIVSQGLARRHCGAEDPVGRRISSDRGQTWARIVGVAGDVRQTGLAVEPPDVIYASFGQFPGYTSTLFVRTTGDPTALADQHPGRGPRARPAGRGHERPHARDHPPRRARLAAPDRVPARPVRAHRARDQRGRAWRASSPTRSASARARSASAWPWALRPAASCAC